MCVIFKKLKQKFHKQFLLFLWELHSKVFYYFFLSAAITNFMT